jgi:hypothetical protein
MKLILKLCTFTVLSLSVISCGAQKPMVSDIRVLPSHSGDDFLIDLSATLELGNVALPSITLPIFIRGGQEVGNVSMTSGVASQNYLNINLNVSAITHLNSLYSRLPNGSLVPLIANNKSIVIPISKGVQIYVSLSASQFALGVSIPFKTLDALGQRVGTTSLFPAFNIKGIIGSAGIYTSKRRGKNGFALVADITSVIPRDVMGELESSQRTLYLNYGSVVPSSSQEDKINKELYKLHKRRTRLRLR